MRNSMIDVYLSVVANVFMVYALSLTNVIVKQDGLVMFAIFLAQMERVETIAHLNVTVEMVQPAMQFLVSVNVNLVGLEKIAQNHVSKDILVLDAHKSAFV